MRYTQAMVYPVLWLLSSMSSASGVAECKRLDEQFDTKAMVSVCEASAANSTAVVDRVESLRLLAIAQVTNGQDEAAQAAFLRMLVISPTTTLSAEASPRVRSIFDDAAKQLSRDGKISATISPLIPPQTSGPVAVEVSLSDPLRRIAAMHIELAAGEQRGVVPLKAGEQTAAAQMYTGVIEPIEGVKDVDWQLVAVAHGGATVALGEPVGGHYQQIEGGGFPFVPVAAAVGVVVAGAATVAGVFVYRNCCAPTQVIVQGN
jgi:hypothetical protein